MAVLAKFRCVSVEGPDEWKNIKLEPVIAGSDENKEFFRWTPSGQITLGCTNLEASKQFEVDKEYFVNFISAEEEVLGSDNDTIDSSPPPVI